MDVLNYAFNYGLLQRLVGRQQFETEGADAGGDGGAGPPTRGDFDFVAYWNPSIVADAQGRAEIVFELPDNLTAWRVLTLTVTPKARMGLGESTFTANRLTEIRPVMPNQVLEGDRFDAGFSVMNPQPSWPGEPRNRHDPHRLVRNESCKSRVRSLDLNKQFDLPKVLQAIITVTF